MCNYDEFNKEKELKAINSKSDITEFGDRLNKNDICSGILLLVGIAGLISCACVRGCQEIKKDMKQNAVSVMHAQKHLNVR
jgi:hypothetical protein